jgi:pimeloyl-ACP methyl ester carboxylesterase
LKIALFALLTLLAAILLGPFLVSVPPLPNTVDPLQLADPDSRFVTVAHIRVHYKEAGEAPLSFVLLHGFGASVFTWRNVMEEFAEVGRTVAYDRPAFGLTERPLQWTGPNPYGDAGQVAIATGLLESLQIDRAVWVANSAGARVAVAVATQFPERVSALVLVDPALRSTSRWLRPLLHTPQLEHLGPKLVRRIDDRGNAAIRKAWHDPSQITEAVYDGYRQPLRARDWDKALWEFTIAPRDPVAQQVTQITQPTLVITGDDDRIVPTRQTVDLAAQIPGSRLVVLADCGHVPQEECPGPFMQAVRKFLDQTLAAP